MIQIPEKTIPAFHSQTILSAEYPKSTNRKVFSDNFTVKPKFALSFTCSHYSFLQASDFKKHRTKRSENCTVYKFCFSICRRSTRMERKKNRLRCGCLCIFIRSKSKSLRRFLVCFLRSATKP